MSTTNHNPGGQFQEPWTIWDLDKLKLTGKPWNPGTTPVQGERIQAPVLRVRVVNGNPRFRLYMNNGGRKGSLAVAFDPIIFTQVLEAIKELADSPAPDKIPMTIKATYHNGQKLEKPTVITVVTAGRSTEGVMYLSVQVKGEAAAVFEFLPSFWADLLGSDGEALPKVRASTLAAKGWVNLMYSMIGTYLVTKVTTNPKGEGQSDKSASPATSSAAWDDDIAF